MYAVKCTPTKVEYPSVTVTLWTDNQLAVVTCTSVSVNLGHLINLPNLSNSLSRTGTYNMPSSFNIESVSMNQLLLAMCSSNVKLVK